MNNQYNLPGMDSLTPGIDLSSKQTVVNEAPSFVESSRTSDNKNNKTVIKSETVSATTNEDSNTSMFLSSSLSCTISFILAVIFAYWFMSNPEAVKQLIKRK